MIIMIIHSIVTYITTIRNLGSFGPLGLELRA